MSGVVDRRRFLLLAGGSVLAGGTAGAAQQPAPPSGAGETGRLFDPRAAGRTRDPVTEAHNDLEIQAIEKQLKCTCGCNLDVYTCRTTDFTCTYSPELHKEIVALRESGLSPAGVIDAYLAKYGSEFRMAPKPEGFNLAGYLVPGLAVLVAGSVLVFVLRRRAQLATAEAAVAELGATPEGAASVPAGVEATPEELERLRRALAEVES